MNNFRQWARREGLEDKKPPEEVRKKIVGSMDVFDLVGNMVDLFIPRALDVFKGMLGGSSKDEYHPLSNKGKFEDKELPKYPNKPD